MRLAAPLAAVAALALLVTGCSGTTSTHPTASAAAKCAPSGSSSDAVVAKGALGTKPDVKGPESPKLTSTQRTVIIDGKGKQIEVGDTITWAYTLVDATSKKVIDAQGYDGASAEFQYSAGTFSGLRKLLACSTVGSRVAGVIPAEDGLGSSAGNSLGIGAKDVLVFVVDILSIVPPLTPQPWTDGVPKVDLGANPPVIDLTGLTAPTDLRLALLKPGAGATVKSGDSVTVDYQGVSWNTKTIFDQSFGKTPATFSTGQVVKGFAAGLIGQKVGSTVLVSIPPQYAYGTDTSQSALANQTLLFLIEIEKTAAG